MYKVKGIVQPEKSRECSSLSITGTSSITSNFNDIVADNAAMIRARSRLTYVIYAVTLPDIFLFTPVVMLTDILESFFADVENALNFKEKTLEKKHMVNSPNNRSRLAEYFNTNRGTGRNYCRSGEKWHRQRIFQLFSYALTSFQSLLYVMYLARLRITVNPSFIFSTIYSSHMTL
jgi:hypothetical protein